MRRLYRAVLGLILAVIVVAFVAQKIFGGNDGGAASASPLNRWRRSAAATKRWRWPMTARSSPGCRCPKTATCRSCRSAQRQKGRASQGPVLEQVRVLAAAPPALRPYVAGSYFGESGVDVELSSGIELRFGGAAEAARKWRAAAAVLADPSITALDYVDLSAQGAPAVGGSGHTLPPIRMNPQPQG